MCMLFLEHRSYVLRLERNSSLMEANEVLVQKMLENNNAGWFSEFISALREAGKCSVCVLCTHVRSWSEKHDDILVIYDVAAM